MISEANKVNYCGCFIIKTQLELAAQENQLYQLACEKLVETERIYQHYLMQSFTENTSIKYAQQLMMTIFGLRIYGYQKANSDSLTISVTALLPWLGH